MTSDPTGGSGPDDRIAARPRPIAVLAGYALRSFLLLTLRQAGSPVTVAELVAGLERSCFTTPGPASKDVSDALRWEVRRGRARRVARATYAPGHIPRQTAWRMRRRLAAHTGT